MKKRFTARREEKGWSYFGVGLRNGDEGLYTPHKGIQPDERPSEADASPSEGGTPVYPVYLSQKTPLMKEEKIQRESFQERYTGYTGNGPSKGAQAASQACGDGCIPNETGIQESSPAQRDKPTQKREVFYL